MSVQHDYETLDKEIMFSYREDRLKQAQKFGYKFITECLVEEYRKLKSMNKVGKKLGLSLTGVKYALNKINEPVQSRGGNHWPKDKKRPGRHFWNPLMIKTKSYESNSTE